MTKPAEFQINQTKGRLDIQIHSVPAFQCCFEHTDVKRSEVQPTKVVT